MEIPRLFNLEGKVALITGASSGLGVAFCEAMAEAGANVVGAARRLPLVKETIKKIERLGHRNLAIKADVSKEEDTKKMVDRILSEFGRIDILINNAGISPDPMPLHKISLKDWNEVIATNLTGVMLCCREVLKIMVEQRKGKVINIASVAGMLGCAPLLTIPAYSASKGAIINLTRELAMEYIKMGINVNAIAPGFFHTNLGGFAKAEPAFHEILKKRIPLGKIGHPDELKGTALYLASSASDFVTGHILVVDGGYSVR